MVPALSSAIAATIFTLAAVPNFFTYVEWAKLSNEGRAAYIAGAFDSLINHYDNDAARVVARHYSECVVRAQLNSVQMSDNLSAYVSARPELRAGTVHAALLRYLADLCGSRPER
jgi:hypothetical protein